MRIFWRVLFGVGALVFGLVAVVAGDFARHFVSVTLGLYGAPHDPFFSVNGFGGGTIELTANEFYAGVAVILLVAASLSAACAYFAFRSDKDKTRTD